jgi:N-acetylglucosaminyldiphosphoundecaprenol N-acetyl-beta-D-mannosaminyltransferase
MFEKLPIISLSVHHLSFRQSLDAAVEWALKRQPSYVCFANAHMTIEAYKDKSFLAQLNNANLVLADGKPLATACRLLHHKKQERISGMDFMPSILEIANERKMSVFFYGSAPGVLKALQEKINDRYPDVHFAGAISPPFQPATEEEVRENIDQINQSGAQLIFVALGCPRQEKWMALNFDKINGVLLGVGGAFPVMAGIQKRAPRWMQNLSLEWLYRLFQQPRRLFKRYLVTNTYFLLLLTREWMKRLMKKQ